MSEITDIKTGKRREKRVNVFLDGRFAFSLLAEVAAQEGLKVGQELSAVRWKRWPGLTATSAVTTRRYATSAIASEVRAR